MSHSRNPLDSILLAVFTVSPNKQYLGIFSPTTPATHGPGRSRPKVKHLKGQGQGSKVRHQITNTILASLAQQLLQRMVLKGQVQMWY